MSGAWLQGESPWNRFHTARTRVNPLANLVAPANRFLKGEDAPVLLGSPRHSGATRWQDPAPFYIQRSLPLLGQTVDTGRLTDVLAAAAQALNAERGAKWNIIGRGRAGVIAASAALLEPRLGGVTVIDPSTSHRDGPVFLNVLRGLDVPEAFGLLAPRPLIIATAQAAAFDLTQSLYRTGGGNFKLKPLP